MYKHYETSDDVFVDREEYIEWMNASLERCKKEPVVLHLKGIGGIGKSSLLNHWMNTHEKTIRLDCEQYTEFYQRLIILAKGAVLQGVKLKRFDILWQIRQQFVEGVEPVREEGREWAKEVVMAIPFIGSLASIGSAINAVGAKVTPKLKGKYGTIGKWLQENLGKNHIEQLLEILWKDPRRAEFLYLSAFLDDINTRDASQEPIVFLLDHFEYVDNVKAQWRFQKQKINETKLWTIFLSNLRNCVGVLASRRSATKSEAIEIEENELTELDRESCLEMMDLHGVEGETLQQTIVSVSGGNPFVIDAICDMINTSDVTLEDIEDLRADTLSGVRLKVWRRLFREAEGLHKLINRAGIVPYFNERIMRIISPEMTPDIWDRMKRLSFVNERSDGTSVLHDLAEELVRAELGDGLSNLVDEVSGLFEKKFDEESDITLLGLAYSVRALKESKQILHDIHQIGNNLSWKNRYTEALVFLNSIIFPTEEGRVFLKITKSHFLTFASRIADAEHEIREALEEIENLSEITEIERKRYRAISKLELAKLYMRTLLESEAIDEFEDAIALAREVNSQPPDHLPTGRTTYDLSMSLWWYGEHLDNMNKLEQAEKMFNEAIQQWEIWGNQVDHLQSESERRVLSLYQRALCNVWIRAGKIDEAEALMKSLIDDAQEPHLIGVRYIDFARIYQSKNRPFEALEWSEKAMLAFNEMPEQVDAYLGTQSLFAQSLYQLGRYSEALLKIEEVLRLARESQEKAPEVFSGLVNANSRIQAVFLRQTGKTSDAEKNIREVLQALRNMTQFSPDIRNVAIAWTLNNRGVIHYKKDNLSKAEKDFSEGLELGRESMKHSPEVVYNVECIAVLLNNLGNLRLTNGRIEEARGAYEEAHRIYEQISKLSVEMVWCERASVLNNLGALLIEEGRISDAEKKLMESLTMREELADRGFGYHKVRIGSTLNNLGILHLRRDEFIEALELFQKAAEKLEETHSQTLLDCSDDLKRTLNNQYIALSKSDTDSEKSDLILKRLRKLGVKKVESESFILDVLESE